MAILRIAQRNRSPCWRDLPREGSRGVDTIVAMCVMSYTYGGSPRFRLTPGRAIRKFYAMAGIQDGCISGNFIARRTAGRAFSSRYKEGSLKTHQGDIRWYFGPAFPICGLFNAPTYGFIGIILRPPDVSPIPTSNYQTLWRIRHLWESYRYNPFRIAGPLIFLRKPPFLKEYHASKSPDI